MKPVAAEFVTSAARPEQFPADGLPEIALVGRSNVGKSSLINCLLGGPRLARTSNTPGRTQTLNWYRVWPAGPEAPAFYFVDMPGYGFARVSQEMRKQWQQLIEAYLTARPVLCGVVQIIDLRHPPTADDQLMWQWLGHYDKPRLCVATKADKLRRAELAANVAAAAAIMGEVCPFSAESGDGRAPVWAWVRQAAQR